MRALMVPSGSLRRSAIFVWSWKKERQLKRLALIFREFSHRCVHQLAYFISRHRFGQDSTPSSVWVLLALAAGYPASRPAAASHVVDRSRGCVSALPPTSSACPARDQQWCFLPDLDEDVLQHILCGVLIIQYAVSYREQDLGKAIVKLLKTRTISVADSPQQLDFAGEFFPRIGFHNQRRRREIGRASANGRFRPGLLPLPRNNIACAGRGRMGFECPGEKRELRPDFPPGRRL